MRIAENSATATNNHAIVVPSIYPCGSTWPVSPGVSFTETTVARGKIELAGRGPV
jgi:hypothetical protein